MNTVNAAIKAVKTNEDDEENVETNPHSFHNIFKQVVACARVNKISESEIFGLLPHHKFSWYSHTQFTRSYNDASAGVVLEGIMSKNLAEGILETVKAFVRDPAVNENKKTREKHISHELPDKSCIEDVAASQLTALVFNLVSVKVAEPEPLSEEEQDPFYGVVVDPPHLNYEEFDHMVAWLEKDRRVACKTIMPFISEEFHFPLKRFLAARDKTEKRPLVAVPFELASKIVAFYEALPSASAPAKEEHITAEKQYQDSLYLQMEASVAKEQMAQGMALYKKSPRRLITAMADLGYPERSVQLLLEGKAGQFVSRRLVAATLSYMGAFAVEPSQKLEQTVPNIVKKYLPEGVIDVQKIAMSLTETFNDNLSDQSDLSIEDIYEYMPPVYQKAINVEEVKGWFDGRVILARKDIVSIFMSAVIAKLQDLAGDNEIVIPENAAIAPQADIQVVLQ